MSAASLFFSDDDKKAITGFAIPEQLSEPNSCQIAPDGETFAAALRIVKGGSIGKTEDPDLYEIALWRPRQGEQPFLEETLIGHLGWISCVDFASDSRLLVSASFDETVRLWDTIRLRQLAELRGHGGAVYAARFSPDGSLLATCSADRSIRLWTMRDIALGSDEAPCVIAADAAPRDDGIGADLWIRHVEKTALGLFNVNSLFGLENAMQSLFPVPGEGRELYFTLMQIANVRAEQARREAREQHFWRWRRLQSQIQMHNDHAAIYTMFSNLPVPDDMAKFVDDMRRCANETTITMAGELGSIAWKVGSNSLEAPASRARLASIGSLDETVVGIAASALFNLVGEALKGTVSALSLRNALELLCSLLPPSSTSMLATELRGEVGKLYCIAGDPKAGTAWLLLGIEGARRSGSKYQLSALLGSLGNALSNLNRLEEAKAAYLESRTLAIESGNRSAFVHHTMNLGNLLKDLGEYRQAYRILHLGLSLCIHELLLAPDVVPSPEEKAFKQVSFETMRSYADYLTSMADVYFALNESDGELHCYETSLQIYQALGETFAIRRALVNIAAVDIRNEEYAKAEARYAELGYEATSNLQWADADVQVKLLLGRADIAIQRQSLQQAKVFLGDAIQLARKSNLSLRLISGLRTRATLSERDGNDGQLDQVEADLKEALQECISLQGQFSSPEDALSVQSYIGNLAHDLISIQVRTGQIDAAFETSESSTGRVLLRQLARQRIGWINAGTVAEVKATLATLGYPAVFIAYRLLYDRICIFLIRADKAHSYYAESVATPSELLAIRHDFEREVIRGFARTDADETWQRLSALIFAPIRSYLNDGDLLIVSMQGRLQGFPVHALMHDSERVVDRWPVVYVPSASAFKAMAEQRLLAVHRCTVIGAHFTEEAKQVARCLRVKPQGGDQLSKEEVLDALRQGDVVHISAHGFYLRREPALSGLLLRSDGETLAYLSKIMDPLGMSWSGERRVMEKRGDRLKSAILTAADLDGLTSGARFVMLSACETGLVHTDAADDPVGLVPALLKAGVNGIGASLWLVDAQVTCELMQSFYSFVGSKHGWARAAFALQDAINEVRTRHASPYFWAPMILIGGIGINEPEKSDA